MTESNSFLNYSDADLKASMRRAIRWTAILAVVGFLALLFTRGWQTAVLFIAGAVVSATGLYEWQQLIGVINAKLDNQRSPRAAGFTLTMFFLRLGFAAAVIYVSLRFLEGSLYALVAGLSLAIIALTVEALRLLRS
jgi:Na+/H+-translocating membrane pyrophosphatase